MNFRPGVVAAIIVGSALLLPACNGGGADLAGLGNNTNSGNAGSNSAPLKSSPDIHILSNRADLISAGDALVQIDVPAGSNAASITVSLNGQDITGAFSQDGSGNLLGLVTGLQNGTNTVSANLPGGDASAQLINHPNGGPVFSGPQLEPWLCQNKDGKDAKDADDCNQPPEYSYYYKSSNLLSAGLQPYNPDSPASDVANTTTDNGVTVPFIVRVETGYQDRDQYKIATLYQPDMPWTPTVPQPQFNHKLLINHGFSCGVDYQTGTAPTVIPSNTTDIPVVGGELLPFGLPVDVLKDATELALGKGFAVMSTALDYSGHNCNVALQAESLMMAKERVIEQYGTLRYTIGEGCSGGSIAQQQISNAYPGIYQGILPTCSFPDAWSTATQFLDYHLLLAYFNDPGKWGSGILWDPAVQQPAVEGHIAILNSIVSDNAQWHVAVPTDACAGVTAEQRYNPDTNPGGVRCSIQDAAINLFGPRPPEIWGPQEQQIGHGFAGFPVDNVGVQYGLAALQGGVISADQFIDLNQKIGGVDYDTNPVPERLVAVEPALTNAYRSGLINEANNLDKTAIIDCRGPDPGLFHDAYRAFAMRARLDREHGNHDNQLIWEGPIPILGDNDCAKNSFKAMDRWLTAVEQDTSDTPLAQKLTNNKPADLKDACWSGVGIKLTDGLCPGVPLGDLLPILNLPALDLAIVPIYATPRMVAGDAITTDANKCQLKPLNRNDNYGLIPFTDAQWAKMQEIFPNGVCDFSKPGVSQQDTIAWQTYQQADGSVIYGGTAMPPAPANSAGGWAAPAFSLFNSHYNATPTPTP